MMRHLHIQKNLIKANYNKATDTEIDTLLKEAKDKSSSGKTAYMEKAFLLVI